MLRLTENGSSTVQSLISPGHILSHLNSPLYYITKTSVTCLPARIPLTRLRAEELDELAWKALHITCRLLYIWRSLASGMLQTNKSTVAEGGVMPEYARITCREGVFGKLRIGMLPVSHKAMVKVKPCKTLENFAPKSRYSGKHYPRPVQRKVGRARRRLF